MENILNLTPLQSLFVLALNVWIFAIFPMLVIRKLNYLTAMMEAQFTDEEQDEQEF